MNVGSTARIEREPRPGSVEPGIRRAHAHLSGDDLGARKKRIAFATLDRFRRAEPGKNQGFAGHDAAVDGQHVAWLDRRFVARFENEGGRQSRRVVSERSVPRVGSLRRRGERLGNSDSFCRDRLACPLDELDGERRGRHHDTREGRRLLGGRVSGEPRR